MRADTGLQAIFSPRGPAATVLSRLGLTLTAVAVAVTIIMCLLIVMALRRRPAHAEPGSAPLAQYGRDAAAGRRWILIGTLMTIGVLVFAAAYSVKVLMADRRELALATMEIRITGYQYWWKVEYLDSARLPRIVEANEIHLPAGTRVRLELIAADVIHSFWIPGLAGKTDLIPGQPTTMWIEADRPGAYRGQCAEYCGMSHANMRLSVIAHNAADFAAWRTSEEQLPAADTGATRIMLAHGCGACHSLAGQMAGSGAPDLTHLAQRTTIGAGVLDNTPTNLRAWLLDPQSIKPGTLMPRTGLSNGDATRLAAWLETLR